MKIFVGMYIINGFTNRNSPSEKLSLVVYGLSVINISKDLQTDKACQKTIYPLHFIYRYNKSKIEAALEEEVGRPWDCGTN
jgi:hypothetical protein